MTKNEILDVIKNLGVELGEIFMIDYGNKTNGGLWYDKFFKFTDEGLCRLVVGRWTIEEDSYIKDLDSGKSKVIRFWKPKDGEKYYVPSLSSAEGYRSYIWADINGFGNIDFYRGIVCKTPREAVNLAVQINNVTRKLLIYNKRMENSNTKDVGEYDYLNLFD